MLFHEKLDFLMNITKTSNSALAMHSALDASHISRLRRGGRKLVKEAAYLKTMAAYFARQCNEDYQISAVTQLLHKPSDVFHNPKNASEEIYEWLLAKESSEPDSITGFLNGISKIQWGGNENMQNRISYSVGEIKTSNVGLYYGLSGKREAVLNFLSIVSSAKDPGTLLLYSDESMDWLIEDLNFLENWKNLLSRVVMQGNHIKIIHTVSRDLNEMLEAISKWMPLYMTGAVEPYYYPKKRDGLFKRTMFIASKKAAVTANSMDVMTDKALNLLLQDKTAIQALEEEFYQYLNLCRPLMHIFTDRQWEAYANTLLAFEQKPSESIVSTGCLSLSTMPADVAKDMLARSALPDAEGFLALFIKGKVAFESNLKKNKYQELIQIPDTSMINGGEEKVFFFSTQESAGLSYTPDEYRRHLEHIIHLLLNYENYHVSLTNKQVAPGYQIYAKENLGVILLKNSSPHLAFVISESNMTAAFWDYLNIIYHESNSNKKDVIRQLQQVLKSLE